MTSYIVHSRSYLARKKSYLARKKIYLRGKIFYLRGRNPRFLAKKEEKTPCLRAFSSSLYKNTTFFAEIQMVLTFEYNSELLNLQRFAAARLAHVLYYEGLFRREFVRIHSTH